MPDTGQKNVSAKVIGRLSLYRRILRDEMAKGVENLFSHDLAALSGGTPARVRRDVMAIGYSGSPAHGYDVQELMDEIGVFLGDPLSRNVALVGIGNLGRALLAYFHGGAQYSLVAAFDNHPSKTDRVVHGCRCHGIGRLTEIIEAEKIDLAMIAVPVSEAQEVVNVLCRAGVKGILNFAPIRVWVPEGVFVESVDMTMSLERVAYFSRQ